MVDKRLFAAWTLAVGVVLGIVGNLFFYNHPHGLSLLVFALLATGAVLGTVRAMRQPLKLRNLWPLLPLLFFAAMGVVRADPVIMLLNVMAIFGLGALVLYYLPQEHAIDEDTLADYTRAAASATIQVGTQPIAQGFRTVSLIWDQRLWRRQGVAAVARGLVFTLPLLLVFAVLLASADAVFAGYINRVWEAIRFPNLGYLIPQLVMIAVLGWLGCGAVAYGARTLAPVDPAAANAPAPAKKQPFILGVIEAMIMLGAVDLLIALFVAIQFRYFFGGQQNVALEGLTYAQYARRGFFELVAVSVLTLGLVLWIDWVTVRHSPRQHRLFRVLAVIMVALVGVMLLSASQRMSLYEQSYGYTHLRVYTHLFMGWLAVLFVFFLLALFRVRDRIFSLGTLVVIIGYLVTLNLLNTEQLIAGANVDRYLADTAKTEIDTCYLMTMSTDALPAMLRLYHETPNTVVKAQVAVWLSQNIDWLDRVADSESVLTTNLSRSSARAVLDPLRKEVAALATQSYSETRRLCGYFGYDVLPLR